MEHLLFVPSTRLHDRIEDGPYGGENFQMYKGYAFSEVELATGGQDLVMNGQCTWKQFTEALGNKIVWIGNAFLDVYHHNFGCIMNYGEDGHVLSVNADIESPDRIHADFWADSMEETSTAIHVFYRLLIASGARMVENDSSVNQTFFRDRCPFSGLALSQLIQQCPSLTHLHIKGFILHEEIVRALWAGAGTNIEIVLEGCTTTLDGTNALIESFRNNLGPTQFLWCDMPTALFANGLRGNSNVKILKLNPPGQELDPSISEVDMRNLVQSLSQNQGLEELDFGEHAFCDESWSMLCQSLARHPALGRMEVTRSGYLQVPLAVPLSGTQKTRRTEMLLEMLKVNTMLHNISLTLRDYNQRIIQDEIRPRLLVNRYRPRVRALRTQNNANFLRAKLLGRALHSVNGHPTILWMFLTSHKDHLMRVVQE
jgi:hypothetical protein